MASTNKILNVVLFFVIALWLIISFQLAACSRAGFGVGGGTSIGTQAQVLVKGSNKGEAAILGARPVPSAPNPFHHHGFGIPAPPPPAPDSALEHSALP